VLLLIKRGVRVLTAAGDDLDFRVLCARASNTTSIRA
jgi:hypothetical protein